MADESTVQMEYTTVQLPKPLHKRVRVLAIEQDTDVKTQIAIAVARYLEQASTQTAQPEAVAQ